jgi:hypothetical protein
VSNDPQSVFDGLLRERGGSQAFDQTQLAVARKLAQLLADDGEVSGSTLTTLVSLLPPKPSDTEEAWDLSLLTDEQLEELDRLAARATGTAPPTPQKPRRGPPRRSQREREGQELARLLDSLEGEADHAAKAKRRYALTDDDLLHVRNLIVDMLGLVCLPRMVFVEVESAEAARQESAVPAAVLETPIAPAPAAPEPKPSNLIEPAFGVFTARRSPFGAPEARTGIDIPRGRW